MTITNTGQMLTHDGRQMLAYARDISANKHYGVWFHDGLRMYDEPAWGMEVAAERKLSVSVDDILVTHRGTLYHIDRDGLRERQESIGGIDNYVAKASDEYVSALGDPHEYMNDYLVRDSDHSHGGYHKQQNES